eukprot:gnl/TRDRNA2_/TRDRNA2_175280_c0_seq3.p1 gnl/TRDRNA2_/TRDRNA2_175280_c0~~gnl/TRDRNA2_/TRDRNA2_175280_c0_seq3.p1  ORF type:complete len:146 (+),score=30.43 gnl/TRDRNA2_/TRDRNA2_175280_c0_seq3:126-563(+)
MGANLTCATACCEPPVDDERNNYVTVLSIPVDTHSETFSTLTQSTDGKIAREPTGIEHLGELHAAGEAKGADAETLKERHTHEALSRKLTPVRRASEASKAQIEELQAEALRERQSHEATSAELAAHRQALDMLKARALELKNLK